MKPYTRILIICLALTPAAGLCSERSGEQKPEEKKRRSRRRHRHSTKSTTKSHSHSSHSHHRSGKSGKEKPKNLVGVQLQFTQPKPKLRQLLELTGPQWRYFLGVVQREVKNITTRETDPLFNEYAQLKNSRITDAVKVFTDQEKQDVNIKDLQQMYKLQNNKIIGIMQIHENTLFAKAHALVQNNEQSDQQKSTQFLQAVTGSLQTTQKQLNYLWNYGVEQQ